MITHADKLADALEELIDTAKCAMMEANRDGEGWNIEEELTEARDALRAYRESLKEGEGMWDCPECGLLRSEELCHSCGNKRTDFNPVPRRPIRAAMTNDAQRIAMAFLDGGKVCVRPLDGMRFLCMVEPSPKGWSNTDEPPDKINSCVPDYQWDLNAVRRVEKKLTDEEFERYRMEISDIVRKEKGARRVDWRSIVSASAAQKTEAILRATGKYTP